MPVKRNWVWFGDDDPLSTAAVDLVIRKPEKNIESEIDILSVV